MFGLDFKMLNTSLTKAFAFFTSSIGSGVVDSFEVTSVGGITRLVESVVEAIGRVSFFLGLMSYFVFLELAV